MKYTIIENYDLIDMEDEVGDMIDGGWEPLGGVAYAESFQDGELLRTYVQAMVKK